jgi:hypothetical protein
MNTLSHKLSTSPAADDLAKISRPSLQSNKHTLAKETEEPLAKIGSAFFFGVVGFIVYAGWKIREREYFTAESGTGYVLGIIGAVLMLLLMIYPLRKRYRFMEAFGSVKFLFQTHMMMGVVGPVCILFHANFHLGSMNSNVALFSMLVVATSGLVGRYFYKRIHFGLYGRRTNLNELRKSYQMERDEMSHILDFVPETANRMLSFSDPVLNSAHSFPKSFAMALTMGLRTRWVYWQYCRLIKKELQFQAGQQRWDSSLKRRMGKEMRSWVWTFLTHVRKVAEFSFYERVFSLWHLFHLPLFFMLLFAGIFHVIAVHAY